MLNKGVLVKPAGNSIAHGFPYEWSSVTFTAKAEVATVENSKTQVVLAINKTIRSADGTDVTIGNFFSVTSPETAPDSEYIAIRSLDINNSVNIPNQIVSISIDGIDGVAVFVTVPDYESFDTSSILLETAAVLSIDVAGKDVTVTVSVAPFDQLYYEVPFIGVSEENFFGVEFTQPVEYETLWVSDVYAKDGSAAPSGFEYEFLQTLTISRCRNFRTEGLSRGYFSIGPYPESTFIDGKLPVIKMAGHWDSSKPPHVPMTLQAQKPTSGVFSFDSSPLKMGTTANDPQKSRYFFLDTRRLINYATNYKDFM